MVFAVFVCPGGHCGLPSTPPPPPPPHPSPCACPSLSLSDSPPTHTPLYAIHTTGTVGPPPAPPFPSQSPPGVANYKQVIVRICRLGGIFFWGGGGTLAGLCCAPLWENLPSPDLTLIRFTSDPLYLFNCTGRNHFYINMVQKLQDGPILRFFLGGG